jgi:hypothetical protein
VGRSVKAAEGPVGTMLTGPRSESMSQIEPTPDGPMSTVHSPYLWAVDDDLRTIGATLGFAQLVGFGQLLLVGLPWYVILPTESRQTVEDLIDTAEAGTTATFELRHLDGHYIPVAGQRVYGGPGWHEVVLSVSPLAISKFGPTVPQGRKRASQ